MQEMKHIFTPSAPEPLGHYSQAMVHQGIAYVAGQVPKDSRGNVPRSIEEQTSLVLGNLGEVLLAANSGMDRVLKVTVYLTDLNSWGKMNEVYASVFGEHRPARTIVPVVGLRNGYQIMIDAVAAVGD